MFAWKFPEFFRNIPKIFVSFRNLHILGQKSYLKFLKHSSLVVILHYLRTHIWSSIRKITSNYLISPIVFNFNLHHSAFLQTVLNSLGNVVLPSSIHFCEIKMARTEKSTPQRFTTQIILMIMGILHRNDFPYEW